MKSICFPPSVCCIRGKFELARFLARAAVYDKMSPPTMREETSLLSQKLADKVFPFCVAVP
jgi:hypothetical protein